MEHQARTPLGRRDPPRSLAELRVRAEALVGRSLGEIGDALGQRLGGAPARTKGLVGELIEKALGASPLAGAGPDFPALGVELKTVPVDAAGAPCESTFVCAIRLDGADRAAWEGSNARRKLAHVLFVPVEREGPMQARRVRAPCFFRPTIEQEAILRADFDHGVGWIGAYGAEGLTAHAGRWLQVRPKARDGRARTLAPGWDGLLVESAPRGFYLRRRFVAAILRDPAALPD